MSGPVGRAEGGGASAQALRPRKETTRRPDSCLAQADRSGRWDKSVRLPVAAKDHIGSHNQQHGAAKKKRLLGENNIHSIDC